MNKQLHWDNLSEEIQEGFVRKAFDQLVDLGFIRLADEPMEDSPGYDMAYESAIEIFNAKYPEGL
jgi:hypothetical protein